MPVHGLALSKVAPCAWECPDPREFDGLLIGSANVFEHGGDQLERLKHLPVLAVGRRTALAAEDAGFTVELTGSGGLQALIDWSGEGSRKLLRLAGYDNVDLQTPAQMSMDVRVVYRVEHLPLDLGEVPDFADHPIILLYSAKSAAHWRAECDRLDVPVEKATIVALGPRIAEAAGNGWAGVHIAERPDEASLLALTLSLWQMHLRSR